MPYLGISPSRTDNRKLDTPLQRVGGGIGFNGSATQFFLKIEGEAVYPDTELLLQAVLNGGSLNPKVDFTIANDIITFALPPAQNAIFFGILGDRISLNKPGSDTVSTDTIKDNAVTTLKIADNAITSDKIAPGTVIASDVQDGAITTIKLDGTVGAEAVTTAKIRDLNVTTGKLANLVVTEGKLADTSISTIKLQNNSVTSDKIAANAVGALQLSNSSVTTNKIAADAITSTLIANGAVGTTELSTGAVTSDKINIVVASDPPAPSDGQLIWNTFSNTAKIYNLSDSRWDELLTTTTGGSLVGWYYISSLPNSLGTFSERTTQLSPEVLVKSYAFNENSITPKHVLVANSGKISSSSNILTWTARTSGTGNNLNSVSWGETGGYFFAGGDGNVLTTSTNGDTWVTQTGPFIADNSNITKTYFANGRQFIGSSTGKIASSTTTTTFTAHASPLTSSINSIVYGNGKYIFGGSAGDIAYTDSTTINIQPAVTGGGSKKVFVQPKGTGFVAVIDDQTSTDVTVKVSSNGIQWSDLILNPVNIINVNSFIYSNAIQAFLITTNEGISYKSLDCKNWSLFNAPQFAVGEAAQSSTVITQNVIGTDYYILFGTKNVSGTLSPYFAVATFVLPNTQLDSNKNYIIDTAYGTVSITLPSNPKVGDIIRLADGSNTWSTTPASVQTTIGKAFLVSTGGIDQQLILDFSGVNIDIVWTGSYWRVY